MALKSRYIPLSLFLISTLQGCTTLDVRGHEVSMDQIDQIKVGTTSKKDVTKLLGTPSNVSPFGNKTWFYISEKTERRAFFKPNVLESQVTRIDFDDQGIVNSLDSLTEKDKQVVSHVSRTTPTAGHKFGVSEQIFGNVGRFNGKDPDMGRRRH